MKNIRFLALFCALLLIVSGCNEQPPDVQLNTDSVTVDTIKYTDEFKYYLQYNQLSDAEKKGYGIIYTAVRDNLSVETGIQDEQGNEVSGIRISLANQGLTLEQISRLFEAFYRDNPLFFFVDRTYSLEGHTVNATQVYDTVVLRYTMNAAQRTESTAQLNTAVQSILNGCPDSNDDYLIELYLHDTLLNGCTYDHIATEAPEKYPNAYSAYGALVEGKAVCEGYAKAMQILLTSVSIPATTVRGFSAENQSGHMWNLVKINGEYYYLDPTWNDNEKVQHYSFFNITTKALQRTHIIDANSAFTVECTAETDNYFIRNNAYITTYDRDVIADAIAAQIHAGATTIHLRFEEGKFENGLLFLKNAVLTKKMVNARLSDGKQMWNYELSAPAQQNTLTLRKL